MSKPEGPPGRVSPDGAAAHAAEIARLLGAGQVFRAIDAARSAKAAHPDHLPVRLLSAQAWLRGGAVAEARAELAKLSDRLDTGTDRLTRAFHALRALRPHLEQDRPDGAALAQVARTVQALDHATASALAAGPTDAETLDLLTDLFAELWQHGGTESDLRRARDYALARAEVRADDGDAAAALGTAAGLSWHLGDRDRARALARQALAGAGSQATTEAGGDGRRCDTALVQAALLLGAPAEAEAALGRLLAGLAGTPVPRAALRRALLRLASAGVTVPADLLARVPAPVVAICAGQGLDPPGLFPPVFPPSLEAAVAEAIATTLDALGVEIGYVGAGAGADILFIEALLRRGAEVNVMLPCDPDDFLAARVRPAGPVWERRHRHALRLADAVTVVTEDRYTGDDTLLRFANQVIDGSARLRAELLDTEPYLVAAGDLAEAAQPGGPADFIDNWGDPGRLRLIHLDHLRTAQPLPEADTATEPSPGAAVPPQPLAVAPRQMVRTLLFADVVGFSGLAEGELPAFWRCLETVSAGLTAPPDAPRPVLVESWGDALYLVMETAEDMARATFALLRAVEALDWRAAGLPDPIRYRIGLHAGPVTPGTHPLTGRPMVTARHVSRGSRIEAIAAPGQVYASQQFVALLTAETSAAQTEARLRGQSYRPPYRAAYLGTVALPKAFGTQAIYLLRETDG